MRSKDRLCSVEGCGGEHKARGWCNAHYRRYMRKGSLDLIPHPCPPQELVVAAYRRWRSFQPVRVREIARQLGCSPTAVSSHLTGHGLASSGLYELGWIKADHKGSDARGYRSRIGDITMGPLFGGALRNRKTGELTPLRKIG